MKDQHLPRFISASLILMVAIALPISAPAQTATINVTANQQTIDGFGFSTAWTPAMTSAQGNILFGTGSGQLGFSLLRIRIDPNENWGNEPSNASTAHSHGAKVLGTAWTPPASMKTNGSLICGDLQTSQYGAYASHLSRAASAINLDFVSFQNQISGVHGSVHIRTGGDMTSVPTAAYDPIFYLHHANVERIWADWQIAHPGPLPAAEASFQLQPRLALETQPHRGGAGCDDHGLRHVTPFTVDGSGTGVIVKEVKQPGA